MDPISAGAATIAGVSALNASTTGIKNLSAGIKSALRRLRLSGLYDPDWMDLGLEGSALTAGESQDVVNFLLSDRAQPVLRFVSLAKLIPTSASHPEIMAAMEDAFQNAAERWLLDSKEKWKEHIPTIWIRLIQIYDFTIPSMEHDHGLSESAESYTYFLLSPLGTPVNKSGLATKYLDRLTELGGNIDLLTEAAKTSKTLSNLIISSGYLPLINHIDVTKRVEFPDLYVKRHFRDVDTNVQIDSESLVSPSKPFRLVLKGAPGAGKSTFISHFVQSSASSSQNSSETPTAVIRCREYVRNAWKISIPEYAAQKISAELSTNLSVSLLEAMLLTGQITFVFDGLDEVTDKSQRAEMVQRIQAFTSQYPPTSILVTTRTVGYERTPLDHKLFRPVELQEFSIEQVREYAQRWFTHAERPELCEAFMSESDTINDLRVNPLLLSLLCNLYKSSGEIPNNRREIYADCAELLFKRWDSHRQILSPHSMPKYANQLMQQIAEWFFNSHSAQSGVEERQVASVIADYMVTDIGMLPEEARLESKQFLEFCADRAWLLGAQGTNDRNQRLYAFTHRTFLEFFAAEAMAREADDPAALASHIRKAFDDDSTSLVPELLIQSYDVVKRRGATMAFQELYKNRSTPTLLMLRLLDGAIIAKYALAEGLKQLIDRWNHSSHGIPPKEFLALLAINPIARGNIFENHLMANEGHEFRRIFIESWSDLHMSGFITDKDIWNALAHKIATNFLHEFQQSHDSKTLNWLLKEGFEIHPLNDPWDYICTRGRFGSARGFVSWAIEEPVLDELKEVQIRAIERVHALTLTTSIPQRALDISEYIIPSPALEYEKNISCHLQKLRDILAAILLAASEEDRENFALDSAERIWPGSISSVVQYRAWKHGHGDIPTEDEIRAALETISALPARLSEWANGGTYLVEDSSLR